MNRKPTLSFWQIWNMCFSFLGIQFGFALQNANASRIFETLGASMDAVPGLWIAAPLTGLLVQPVVGYLSDRTWTRWGRRRPFFMLGAVLTTLALLVMPNSPTLWIAAGTLWVLDASINVSMEPFRAFVGDQLAPRQRPAGYAMQSFFIGVGAIVASLLPFLLAHWGVANTAPPGEVPDTVRYAFYFGAVVLLAAIAWTVFSTREYSPAELAAFDDAEPAAEHRAVAAEGVPSWGQAGTWLLLGVAAFLCRKDGSRALQIGWRDRYNHSSPNCAWSEASVAGALGIRLGGPNDYFGERVEKPWIGDAQRDISVDDISHTIRLMWVASMLALALFIALRWLLVGVA